MSYRISDAELGYIEKIKMLTLLSVLGFATIVVSTLKTSSADSSDNLVIKGLLSNPLNLTYGQLESFPMVWEIAPLQCVSARNGTPYNWTGVPLFYLLNLAQVQPGAKEVVFRASDGFSSSITLDKAMHPTTLLALQVNGTTLPVDDGYPDGLAGGYPYKAVVPCKYGYKWVGWIDEIEVVDYDYKGTWESRGFSDEADIPNCTELPETNPAYAVFNATWRDVYEVTVFSNATISEAGFNQTVRTVSFKVSAEESSWSFVYVIVPKLLLAPNFTVLSDNATMQHSVMWSEKNSFLYFTLDDGPHSIEVRGMLFADVNFDGRVDMKDIGYVCMAYGSYPGHPKWNPNMDINNDNKVDMKDIGLACKNYGKH